MPRNKYPEKTVSLILDVSHKLFSERGYSQVKMQDIVEALEGLTKGAVYHHFKNKEDIYDALLLRHSHIFDRMEVIQKSNLSGFEKIKRMIIQGIEESIQNKEIIDLAGGMFQTPRFLHRLMESSQTSVVPMIHDMIEQGNADGSLFVQYPKEAAEAFTLLVNIWMNVALFPADEGEYMRKILQCQLILKGMGLDVIDEAVLTELKKLHVNFG